MIYCVETGAGRAGTPLVLLHGFGSHAGYWEPLRTYLQDQFHVLAFDLPGHGRSPLKDEGRPRQVAQALFAELEERSTGPVHLCGHSMGGAIACVMALENPQMVKSLTLLAPGGFGPEVNARLIKRFAAADSEEELLPLLEPFYGWRKSVPQGALVELAASRQHPGVGEHLTALADYLFGDDTQREVGREAVAALEIPVKVIWGTQDRITPTRQAHKLPGVFAGHIFEGVGHSLADEIPAEIARLLREQMR